MDIHGAESGWSEPFNVTNINPPDAPVIDGPSRGKAATSYSYTFNLTDPDGDDIVEFTVKWGDSPDEIFEGPFDCGSSVRANHTWNSQRTFTIKAKAKDIYGAESGWSEFEVEIPRNKATTYPLILSLFERFPNAFPILRYILGLQ